MTTAELGWNEEASKKAFAIIQVRDDGTLDQDISGRNSEKWLDSGALSKHESQRLTRGKESVKDDSKEKMEKMEKREGGPCHQLRRKRLQVEQIWGGGRVRIPVLDIEFDMPARYPSDGIQSTVQKSDIKPLLWQGQTLRINSLPT